MSHSILPVAIGVFVFVIVLGFAIDVAKWGKRRYLDTDADESQTNSGGEQ